MITLIRSLAWRPRESACEVHAGGQARGRRGNAHANRLPGDARQHESLRHYPLRVKPQASQGSESVMPTSRPLFGPHADLAARPGPQRTTHQRAGIPSPDRADSADNPYRERRLAPTPGKKRGLSKGPTDGPTSSRTGIHGRLAGHRSRPAAQSSVHPFRAPNTCVTGG
jgi:hypothetical protein